MLVTMLVFKWEIPQIFIAVGITALIGFTYNARLARSVWLALVVDYNPNWKEENAQIEAKKKVEATAKSTADN
jgi:hypothetical protein